MKNEYTFFFKHVWKGEIVCYSQQTVYANDLNHAHEKFVEHHGNIKPESGKMHVVIECVDEKTQANQ
jgi:hypothetical protein